MNSLGFSLALRRGRALRLLHIHGFEPPLSGAPIAAAVNASGSSPRARISSGSCLASSSRPSSRSWCASTLKLEVAGTAIEAPVEAA